MTTLTQLSKFKSTISFRCLNFYLCIWKYVGKLYEFAFEQFASFWLCIFVFSKCHFAVNSWIIRLQLCRNNTILKVFSLVLLAFVLLRYRRCYFCLCQNSFHLLHFPTTRYSKNSILAAGNFKRIWFELYGNVVLVENNSRECITQPRNIDLQSQFWWLVDIWKINILHDIKIISDFPQFEIVKIQKFLRIKALFPLTHPMCN